MSEITPETIDHLVELCRIDATAEERTRLCKNLTDIVAYFEQLEGIDTEEVPPCNFVLGESPSPMREDRIEESRLLARQTFLENSPAHVGGLIQVPPVIES
ncbi:MAG: Asp-tRNA(Asn)/Glu-tRNA(Gln) amidotransferase subunit GatC [Parachlamydiales bacterium]